MSCKKATRSSSSRPSTVVEIPSLDPDLRESTLFFSGSSQYPPQRITHRKSSINKQLLWSSMS
jgi:hypothetical protein